MSKGLSKLPPSPCTSWSTVCVGGQLGAINLVRLASSFVCREDARIFHGDYLALVACSADNFASISVMCYGCLQSAASSFFGQAEKIPSEV